MKTAMMGRFYRSFGYGATGTFGLGYFTASAYIRTKHDAPKVRKLMAAVVQGALEGVGAMEEYLRRSGSEINIPDIEVMSEDGKARSDTRFRLVGKKVEVVEERRAEIRTFEEGNLKGQPQKGK
jgi:hypothetical protein